MPPALEFSRAFLYITHKDVMSDKWIRLTNGTLLPWSGVRSVFQIESNNSDEVYSHLLIDGTTYDFLNLQPDISYGNKRYLIDIDDVITLNYLAVQYIQRCDETVIDMDEVLDRIWAAFLEGWMQSRKYLDAKPV